MLDAGAQREGAAQLHQEMPSVLKASRNQEG